MPRRLLSTGQPSSPRAAAARRAAVEVLDSRFHLSAATSASGLPLLHSLPGAVAAIFLDFDGFDPWYTPYDTDGNPDGFGPAEQDAVRAVWDHVASDFSMFDVDVTTEQPAEVPYSYSVISNSVATGSFNQGYFPSDVPINIHPSADATNRLTVFAHEIGHSFRLEHQSVFSERGGKLAEYHPGLDTLHGAIMGVDTAQPITKWFIGHPSSAPANVQDDVAVIASSIATHAHAGDGFRPDDFPGDFIHPASLAPGEDGTYSASGIIERYADEDAFAFTGDGRAVRIDVVPPRPSMLDAKLEVYTADGTLIAAADGPANDQHLTMTLPPETCFIVVSSHGDCADLGQYELSVGPAESLPDEPFDPSVAAPGAPLARANGPGRIDVAWTAAVDATGYAVERSEDGAAWGAVAETDAAATTYANAPPLAGHRYFYRIRTLSGPGRSRPSATASAVSVPAAPSELAVTTLSGAFVLNWRDVGGETAYRVERRIEADGGAGVWVTIARLRANVTSVTDRSLSDGTRYHYRVVAQGTSGDSTPADVLAATPITEVRGMRVGQVTASSVELSWGAITAATGYLLERSGDGVTFAAVATLTAPVYVDTSVEPAHQYYYRVTGTNDLGQSATSTTVLAVTRGTALPGWSVTDVGIDPSAATAGAPVAYAEAGGAYTLLGSGDGLVLPQGTGRTSDAMRYIFRGLVGDGSITAHIAFQERYPALGMAGIMMRDGVSPDGRYIFAGISPQLGAGTASRATSGTRATNFMRFAAAAPCWLRIVRAGQSFTVLTFDQTRWRQVASYNVAISGPVQVALVACAGNSDQYSAVTIDGVSISRGEPLLTELPAASPQVVEGADAELTVLGFDGRNEANLTYTWSTALAPPDVPAPRFSQNGTNEAKHVTATFAGAGHYVFEVRAANGAGTSAAGTVAVDVVQRPSDVRVAPAPGPVHVGSALEFTATVLDQFGRPAGSGVAPPVAWSTWIGSIDEGGRYTAPPYAGWERVTADSGGTWNSADFYVYDDSAAVLLSAVSRKVHGRRGAVDLPLALYGAPAVVEPRRGGPTTLLFEFSRNIAARDGVLDADDFILSNATFRSARIAGNVLTLELGGAADGRVVSVSLNGLTDVNGNGLLGDTDVDVRALYGDVDRDGQVTNVDMLAMRRRLARPTAATADLLFDIDLSGSVTAADVLLARRRIGRAIA